MSDDVSETISQWHDICIGWCNGSIPLEVTKAFHAKHGPAIVAECMRRADIQQQEQRTRPCPVCKAKVGKPCKDEHIGVVMSWHHEERHTKEAA